MLMEDFQWIVCVCVSYMIVSMCDCYFKFWHLFLMLSVVKRTINKRKSSPPLLCPHPAFSVSSLSGPDVRFIHSAGSLNDITMFMRGEGSAWALRHVCYLGLVT